MKLIPLQLRSLALIVLCLFWVGSNAQTFLLNDSTICTSIENVQETAQRILILEAKIEAYQKALENTVNDSKERDQLIEERKQSEKQLKQIKRKLRWQKVKTPFFSIISFFAGYYVSLHLI